MRSKLYIFFFLEFRWVDGHTICSPGDCCADDNEPSERRARKNEEREKVRMGIWMAWFEVANGNMVEREFDDNDIT